MDIQNYYERFGQNFKNRYLYDFGINPVHLHAKSCFCSSNSVLVIFQYVLLIFSKLTIGDRELPVPRGHSKLPFKFGAKFPK